MIVKKKYKDWIEARKRHHLSHMQVQMAMAVGMNPNKLGKIDNHKQESWKVPLPQFIEHCYFKSFKKEKPEKILSIEEMIKLEIKKKNLKKKLKEEKRQNEELSKKEVAIQDFSVGTNEIIEMEILPNE